MQFDVAHEAERLRTAHEAEIQRLLSAIVKPEDTTNSLHVQLDSFNLLRFFYVFPTSSADSP